jgi:hypothetical protein
MTIRVLAEVGARLEEAVSRIPGRPTSPQDMFDRYESSAIQILDSEHDDFEPGLLQKHLLELLHQKQKELDLVD